MPEKTSSVPKLVREKFNVQPDAPDLRDRIYSPTLRVLEPVYNAQPFADPVCQVRVRNQGDTNACTGFALAALVEALLDHSWRANYMRWAAPPRISPYMLYYFARRYDDLPGEKDLGSTARGGMKAWHKHGACSYDLWPETTKNAKPADDKSWIADAFKTPLGAYYRVDHKSVADLHAAIFEAGVVYVTATIHSDWAKPGKDGTIRFSGNAQVIGGHAFVIVGYDEEGFWIQNSWGDQWGQAGYARLTYADWLANSMDAWVAQLGVQISRYADTLGGGLTKPDAVEAAGDPGALLSSNPNISGQQINPYIIDLENDGVLSDKGQFATSPQDLQELVSHYLPAFIETWKIGQHEPIDIAIYCHGGLTPEAAAANTARNWVPALFAQKIFPIFIMWETGWDDIIRNIISDAWNKIRGAAGLTLWDKIKERADEWWTKRIENLLSGPGTLEWNEMKENAEKGSSNQTGGLRQLYRILLGTDAALVKRLRFHLIGHSAGAVYHSHLAPLLLDAGLRVDGIYFMAPACQAELFKRKVLPRYVSGEIACYTQFHLSDPVELLDKCTDLYHHSLLYLVSNAFEGKRETPILGMEKFFQADAKLRNRPAKALVWDAIASPTGAVPPVSADSASNSTSHGGFDEDVDSRRSIILRIAARQKSAAAAPRARRRAPKPQPAKARRPARGSSTSRSR